MGYLYHGSAVEGLGTLRAGSLLHGTEQRGVYLTDNIPYALFYIWDVRRTGYPFKHITAWVERGLAQYEEQFDGQLAAFYQGASGWLYQVEGTPEVQAVKGREGLFFYPGEASVARAEFIPEVYEALMEQERQGRAAIWRFGERPMEKQAELTDRIAQMIAGNGFYQGREEAGFYRKYFAEAWRRAGQLAK